MASTNAAAFRIEFEKNIETVIGGHPAHNLIAGLTKAKKGAGSEYWVTGLDVKASDEASAADYADDSTLRKFHEMAGGSQTFANWLLTRTPHMGTVKISTLSEAQDIMWGHSWNVTEDGDWIMVVDPKSDDMDACARKIHKKLDILAAQAIIATTVSRKVSGAGVASISMPASQILADVTYATATVDTIPAAIREAMGNAYAAGMPIFCAVSTKLARNLKKNDSTLFRSQDFIASYADYAAGNLPRVEGVTFIEMPKSFMEAVKAVEGTDAGDQTDHYFAWTPQAIAGVEYVARTAKIAEDPGAKFEEVGLVRQLQDYVRTQDLGVVVGDVVVA